MKRILAVLCLMCFISLVYGQWSGYMATGGSELDGGVGMTWIDEQPYYNISFQPDISIGKLGIGLNLDLLINTDTGKIRSEDWDEDYDYARMIRYLRWGLKGDKVYARIGALDAARIGHGFILNFYNNQINYDKRKLGLSFDVDFGMAGFESMTNNLGRLQVIGGRVYVRPMYSKSIPVLRNLGFGASYVTDVDLKDAFGEDESIGVWGVDVDLPLVKTDLLNLLLYADHAAIVDPQSQKDMINSLNEIVVSVPQMDDGISSDKTGSGQTIGIRADLNALWNNLNLSVNFERRFLGKHFIANYYGPMYEVLRQTSIAQLVDFYEANGGILPEEYDFIRDLDIPITQKMLLPMITEKRHGWYGALYLDFFKFVKVMGSYQRIDDQDNSGALHFGAGLSDNIPFIQAEATYDKIGIDDFEDVRTLDNRSVARVGVGYKVKPYLLIYMDYIWNFVWSDKHMKYISQERVQPRLAFRYPFNL
ncbi:hypothetical protein JW835_02840 [bacterium]|nr:hypothetical protein [bacterium]